MSTEVTQVSPNMPHGYQASQEGKGSSDFIFNEVTLSRQLLIRDRNIDRHVIPDLGATGESEKGRADRSTDLSNLVFNFLLCLSDSLVEIHHSVVQARVDDTLSLLQLQIRVCFEILNILLEGPYLGEDVFGGGVVREIQHLLLNGSDLL